LGAANWDLGTGNWEPRAGTHNSFGTESRLITKRRRCRRRINPLIKVTSKAAQRQKAIKASEMRNVKCERRSLRMGEMGKEKGGAFSAASLIFMASFFPETAAGDAAYGAQQAIRYDL